MDATFLESFVGLSRLPPPTWRLVEAALREGQSPAEVRALLGRPAAIATYAPRPDEAVWTWRWLKDEREAMVFRVYFGPEGTVRRTETASDPRTMAGA